MRNVRVLLVDDHQLVLDGLSALLSGVDGYNCIGTALNGQEALKLLNALTVDVVLMDVDMPVMDGVEATKRVKKDFPEIKVISLTQHNERGMAKRLLDCGADGYLIKNSSQEDLIQAINLVLDGKRALSNELAEQLSGTQTETSASGIEVELTEREVEILTLIAEGLSSKQIGEKLFISPRTVDTHRTNMMNKLDIHNIAGLIRFAMKNGYA
jgi:DNA-binding NarL/FixJ family response regulator